MTPKTACVITQYPRSQSIPYVLFCKVAIAFLIAGDTRLYETQGEAACLPAKLLGESSVITLKSFPINEGSFRPGDCYCRFIFSLCSDSLNSIIGTSEVRFDIPALI